MSFSMSKLRLAVSLFTVATLAAAQSYTISTVAGGAAPVTPVPAINAAAGQPTSVAADANGNVYFTSLNAIFRIDARGNLTRLAGTTRGGFSGDGGFALDATLKNPNGLAIDSQGNVYVADSGNSRIRVISTDGKIRTIVGNGNIGRGGDGGPAS